MEAENCSKSSGSVVVADVNGRTSDSVLSGERNDSTTVANDGVRCSNISTHDVHDQVADNVTTVSESGTSKAKAKELHVVDLSAGGESDSGQRVCRICHFGPDETPDRVSGKSVSSDLIEIGCKCKNELGLAHFHCAEAWFKLRGNSVCEICGCTAKNVTVRLTDERSEVRDITLDGRSRRGRGQSCCIFMVFLLSVLMLHWCFQKISGYNKST